MIDWLMLLWVLLVLPVILLLPGLCVMYLFFSSVRGIDRITYSVVLSMIIGSGIAVLLGYSESWTGLSGGLTYQNAWYVHGALLYVLVVLCGIKWMYVTFRDRSRKKLYDHLDSSEQPDDTVDVLSKRDKVRKKREFIKGNSILKK